MEGPGRRIAPSEAARRLGVSTRTVQRWLRQGRLPGVRIGSRLKVDIAGLATWPEPSSRGGRRPIRTLLVANRGEIAVRIARTCRRLGVRCLALVAPDEHDAWWANQADGQVPLAGGYLDGDAIARAALAGGADAVHPGYGFLSESAAFAEAVSAAGLAWVGPPAPSIRLLGDKVAARRLAAREGVPVLPGSEGGRQSDRALAREADRIGYPVLVKPVAGGGGKGMHVVRVAADLRQALARARREALAAFADDRLLLERYLDRPRHVEIQVLLDAAGAGVHLGERECSLQRRHQKVVEESPSPALGGRAGERLRLLMGEAALRVAAAAGYVGAGTVEFLLDEEQGEFFFLEMNTRLQVEHPVTELVTGRDLVADQVAIAEGAVLGALAPAPEPRPTPSRSLRRQATRRAERPEARAEGWGHAIEARLYAEGAEQGFLPASGRIAAIEWPAGDGIRIDAGIGPGDVVGTRYDPLLAKIVVGGADRGDAIRRLRGALDGTVTLGIVTNLRFLRWVASAEWFARGETFTDTVAVRWHPQPGEPAVPEEAWRAAARTLAVALPEPLSGWRLNLGARLRIRTGEEVRTVEMPGGADRSPAVHGPASAVERTPDDPNSSIAHVDVAGRSVPFALAPPPEVDLAARVAAQGGTATRTVTAPMPGRVISVAVRAGELVEIHQPLVVLEAMKMENAVTATVSGTVSAVHVQAGRQVQRGDLLVEIAE